mmetsp:Transcript_12047/g.33351  ORF Transcript_12047/g.33351 Transcript_12047/m.33351 type:complete len:393 (-) Transcript_12047:710-1888(-)
MFGCCTKAVPSQKSHLVPRRFNRVSLFPVIVLVQGFDVNPSQHLPWEQAKQRPCQIQRVEDGPRFVGALRHELGLELLQELQVQQILVTQRLFSHNSLHGQHVLSDGIASIHLVRDGGMVVPRHAFANGTLHQTTEGGKHVDRWENLPVVQLSVNVDLSLRNVPSEIRNWMCDVIVGHRQDRQLRDGALPPFDPSGPLVDSGQIRVHVSGVSSPSGHLLSGSRDFSQGVGVRGHIRQNDQHVLAALVREVLCRGQGNSRGDNPLNRRIVRQVEEKDDLLQRAVLLEILLEEGRRLHVHSHGSEDDGEVLLLLPSLSRGRLTEEVDLRLGVAVGLLAVRVLHQTSLPANLGSDFVVRETSRREQRNLLTSCDGVHHVDRRDSRLNHLLGVRSL